MVATDLQGPEDELILQDILGIFKEVYGYDVVFNDNQITMPVNDKASKFWGLSIPHLKRDVEESLLEDMLKVPDWEPEKLREFANHPRIIEALDAIAEGVDKNNALVDAYRKIAEEETRIHSMVYKKPITAMARNRSGNENINVLAITSIPDISAAVAYGPEGKEEFSYHFVGRGFKSLAFNVGLYDNDDEKRLGDMTYMHIDLEFIRSLCLEDRKAYIRQILAHEYGHQGYGMKDHHDGRDCIMDTCTDAEGYLAAAKKQGNPRFCDDCQKKIDEIIVAKS